SAAHRALHSFPTRRSSDLPSLAMRGGDFSELLNPTNFYYNKVVTIKDPVTGVAFPNNVIPKTQLSPNGVGILKAFPKSRCWGMRSEEHTSELQSRFDLVCR